MSKQDCRAYRVFEFYIERLIQELVDDGMEANDAQKMVLGFSCAQDTGDAQLTVFACSTCKNKCATRQGAGTKCAFVPSTRHQIFHHLTMSAHMMQVLPEERTRV